MYESLILYIVVAALIGYVIYVINKEPKTHRYKLDEFKIDEIIDDNYDPLMNESNDIPNTEEKLNVDDIIHDNDPLVNESNDISNIIPVKESRKKFAVKFNIIDKYEYFDFNMILKKGFYDDRLNMYIPSTLIEIYLSMVELSSTVDINRKVSKEENRFIYKVFSNFTAFMSILRECHDNDVMLINYYTWKNTMIEKLENKFRMWNETLIDKKYIKNNLFVIDMMDVLRDGDDEIKYNHQLLREMYNDMITLKDVLF